jgi:hypothetical protein
MQSRPRCRCAATMSSPKKVKMSDDPVPAEPDSQVFQALDQVQQKLDQVCVYKSAKEKQLRHVHQRTVRILLKEQNIRAFLLADH